MANPDRTPATIDDEERQWLESLMPHVRTVVERVGSGAASSEYVIDVQRLRGRHVQLRLIADVMIDDDEKVIVSWPHDLPVDTDARGRPARKARRTRRL